MENLHKHEKEQIFLFLMAFCRRVSTQQPWHYDAVKAIREQAEREYRAGILFSEAKGEKMWEKHLAPFKEIAKSFKVTVKGTLEERTKRQLETYLSTDKERKTTNAALLQK